MWPQPLSSILPDITMNYYSRFSYGVQAMNAGTVDVRMPATIAHQLSDMHLQVGISNFQDATGLENPF